MQGAHAGASAALVHGARSPAGRVEAGGDPQRSPTTARHRSRAPSAGGCRWWSSPSREEVRTERSIRIARAGRRSRGFQRRRLLAGQRLARPLRAAADSRPEYAVFGGAIAPLWRREPEDWILRSVRLAPMFALTDPACEEGPCDPARVWGPNMAIRAEPFEKGFRFDEDRGPNGSETYAMGGETELTLRLAIAERLKCWHCADARVRHIVTPAMMTRGWVLRRSFRFGRCLFRESRQRGAARDSYVHRPPDGHPRISRSQHRGPAVRRTLGRSLVRRALAPVSKRWLAVRSVACPPGGADVDAGQSASSSRRYDRARVIGRAIRSVLGQTYRGLRADRRRRWID